MLEPTAEALARGMEALWSDRARVREMIEAGVWVGIGTDSVASNNICDLLDEARTASFIHSTAEKDREYWNARRMLSMMTVGGAEAIGMQNEIGTLEAGKQADLTVIDLEEARLQPVSDGGQICQSFLLKILPAARLSHYVDFFFNCVHFFEIGRPIVALGPRSVFLRQNASGGHRARHGFAIT